ncbi:unnamed protein product [Didymodactylos carnosus]|uniref:Uncharacterized protein n=1 Tax=Didymodactylos carnosus TaxID=1234261 RepID=A0A815WZ82_9BILA|nr:unnamed protein product [Didymodactylos carnosus]CAF4407951.1 unnamed protein product [Didymodactylos carnosus]
MIRRLAKLHDDNLYNWDEYLPARIFAYNTGLHSTTGYSPFQLMFACEPILPFDLPTSTITLTKPNDCWTQINQLTKTYKKNVKNNIIHQQQLCKQHYDQQRADPTYKPGDLVFIKQLGKRPKFGELYSGPFKVLQQQHPLTYSMEDDQAIIQQQVHVSRMEPVYERII